MMNRIALVILVSILFHTSYGQSFIDENLTQFKWIADSEINELNLGEFKNIGLAKLQVPLDSLQNECAIWTFTGNELIIQKYTKSGGLETDSISCSFEYKNGELIIYHFAQDSTSWKYSVHIISTTNYISLIKKKE